MTNAKNSQYLDSTGHLHPPQPPWEAPLFASAAPAGFDGTEDQSPTRRSQSVRPRHRAFPALVAVSLVSAVLGGAVAGSVVNSFGLPKGGSVTISSDGKGTITTTNEVVTSDLSAVIQDKLKSVVTVSVMTADSGGTGSGVILNDEGYIVTNAHVVTLGGLTKDATLSIQTNSGEIYDATLVGYDASADIAVLKVDAELVGTEPIRFASSDAIVVGSQTIAIGSPLGLSGTVTTGIVSALNRPITVTSSEVTGGTPGATTPGAVALSAIQTDAAINPGNSGGALLDANGNLIGINVAIAGASQEESGNIGVGFAIPSDYVQRVASEIIAYGSASHALLGLSAQNATEENATFTSGALISDVTSGAAAGKAGLRTGDVIIAVNGKQIVSSLQLTAVIRQFAPKTEVTVTYLRDDVEETVTVALGSV